MALGMHHVSGSSPGRAPVEDFPARLGGYARPAILGWPEAVRVTLTQGGNPNCIACEQARVDSRERPTGVRRDDVTLWVQTIGCGSTHKNLHLTLDDGEGRVMLTLASTGGWAYTGPLAARIWDLASDEDDPGLIEMLAPFAVRAREYAQEMTSTERNGEELVGFALCDWDLPTARAAHTAGMGADDAFGFIEEMPMDIALAPEEALAWWQTLKGRGTNFTSTSPGFVTAEWLLAGVPVPELLPERLTSREALALRDARLPLDDDWSSPRLTLCHRAIKVGARSATPAAVVALIEALDPQHSSRGGTPCLHADGLTTSCGWAQHETDRVEAQLRAWEGLSFADLTACLRAGMTAEQAEEHVRSGADMEPVRLIAALA